MNSERILRIEHLALAKRISLKRLCAHMRRALDLPEFEFDSENETAWGWCELDGIEYNVSKPYRPEKLREWDDTVPKGCNAAIMIILAKDHPRAHDDDWILGALVPSTGMRIAAAIGAALHHHRTWLGVDCSETRARVFKPAVT